MEKLIKDTEKIKKEFPAIHVLIIVLSLAVVFLAGSFIMEIIDTPQRDIDKLEFFIDLLFINLTVAGVFISVLSYSAYRFLHYKLEQKTESFFADKEDFLNAKSYSTISYSHFVNYEICPDQNNKKLYLDEAINMATSAYKRVRSLDQNKHINLQLTGDILNNLGYYLAERGAQDDKEMTLKYASFLEKNLALFPERGGNYWVDTIKHIKKKYKQ